MKLELEVEGDSDSTTYYARLGPAGSEKKDDFEWRAHLWIMPTKVADDMGKPFEAQVYFDPDTAKPAAIEYPNGMLWVIAGSGAVRKLSR